MYINISPEKPPPQISTGLSTVKQTSQLIQPRKTSCQSNINKQVDDNKKPKDGPTWTGEKTSSVYPLPVHTLLKKSLARTYPIKCDVCNKILENLEDVKWHTETKYGIEDCRILKSMLL